MTKQKVTKLVQGGEYIAKVDIELTYTDEEWSPYLSLDDAMKMDTVREALRRGDLDLAASYAHVFRLVPLAA